jgi:cardiolipin synthase A/B
MSASGSGQIQSNQRRNIMSRSLIVMPDDTARPILQAIARATKSIRIKMFLFSDPSLLKAVIDAHKRGVDVRIMLNPSRRDGKKENADCRMALTAEGIKVIDSNPEFDVTHEKSMVIDDSIAFVQSLNWDTENLTATRDYAIATTHKHEVEEIAQCFDDDWTRSKFDASAQNERYQDPVIIEHLIRAHTRGVKIHIMARPPHKLKKDKLIEGVSGLRSLQDIGVKIHKLQHIKLHAKLILADDARAIIGSINLAPGSFDSRRELAIEVDDDHIVRRIKKTLERDWENSHPLDLSDEGLFAELKDYDPNVKEDLAISGKHAKGK